jgi:hypothetical protein
MWNSFKRHWAGSMSQSGTVGANEPIFSRISAASGGDWRIAMFSWSCFARLYAENEAVQLTPGEHCLEN